MGNLITPGILDEKESKIDLFKVRIKKIVYSSKLIGEQTQVTVQRRNNNVMPVDDNIQEIQMKQM